MKSIAKIITKFSRALDKVAGFFYMAMLILVACNVVMRKVFKSPISGTIELVEIFSAVAAGLAIAYCAVKGGHIAIEFVIEYFPERFQRIVGIFTTTITIVTVTVSGWMIVEYANTLRVTGRYTGSLKIAYYPFVYLVAIGFFAFALVEIVKIFVPNMNEEV